MYRQTFLKWLVSIVFVLVLIPGLAQAQLPLPQNEEPGRLSSEEFTAPVATQSIDSALALTSAFSSEPAYDSGWVPLAQDTSQTLNHNLGGDIDDYVVQMDYQVSDSNGINQRYYGGADFGTKSAPGASAEDRVGAYWRSLTTSTITVYRRPEDIYADFVRIRIWVDPSPDYDSGWISLTPGASATTLTHSLGGNPDDYVVDMQYKNGTSGINQRYFGGADFGAKAFNGSRNNDRVGLYWRSLTNSTITLFRRAEDDYAVNVRIRIWLRPAATYDSGWVTLNQNQAKTLAHNIGGDPGNYVVDMQFRSPSNGVNQRHYGGADFGNHPPSGMGENDRVGAYWRTLTASNITVYRRPEDIYAPEVRIRIWHYWQPQAPDYDSDWVSLGAGAAATTLTHGLGGSADDYLVDMTYRASGTNGVNLRYYGGADFGTKSAPGHSADDRVGAYWRSLTNSSITVFRRAEDNYAPDVRVRIWKMPKPDFDSGWVSYSQNQSKTFTHNLRGDIADYLVDIQYRTGSSGVNQRYFGGADFGANPAPSTSPDDRVGAYWRSLSTTSITVYRRPDDIYASEVRIRIWRMAKPAYDSGWVAVSQNTTHTLNHKLGGNPDNYLLVMWQHDAGFNGANQRHYGGADFGVNPPSGYAVNDRVGAYWRSLTGSNVTVYRRPEDGFAQFVRIRIWDYNQRIYLPTVLKP